MKYAFWAIWGEEPGAVPHPIEVYTANGFLGLDRLKRDPRYDRARRLVQGIDYGAAYVERGGVAGLRAGDILVGTENPAGLPGQITALGLDDYEALRVATKAGDEELTSLTPGRDAEFCGSRSVEVFVRTKNKWGRSLKVWRPRLFRVRYPVEVVSSPIQASSDDAALFELLYRAGGRMPNSGASGSPAAHR